jgi:hypothetical protein
MLILTLKFVLILIFTTIKILFHYHSHVTGVGYTFNKIGNMVVLHIHDFLLIFVLNARIQIKS